MLIGSLRSLCDVARRFPEYIAIMLQRENALSRGRFCEETFTDLLTAAMIPFMGKHVQIAYPDEPDTGGDIDFIFDNAESGRQLIVRVQAKRLNQQFEGNFSGKPGASKAKTGRENKFENRRYNELLHVVKKSGAYQYEKLTSDPTVVPLYAFYNHQEVVDEARRRALVPEVSGVNLAFADRLKPSLDEEKAGLTSKPQKKPGNKKLTHLQPWFFGLDVLFCPGQKGLPVPTPELVAERLRDLWRAEVKTEKEPVYIKLTMAIDAGVRSVGTSMFLSDEIAVSSQIERPTIRFVSGLGDEPDDVARPVPDPRPVLVERIEIPRRDRG